MYNLKGIELKLQVSLSLPTCALKSPSRTMDRSPFRTPFRVSKRARNSEQLLNMLMECPLRVENESLPQMEELKYLGVLFHE